MIDQENGLPVGWAYVTLSDVCNINMGQSPSSEYYNSHKEGLPFFQGKAEFGCFYPTAVKWCTNPIKVADKDDILISVRAPVGTTNLALEKCCIGRGLSAIRPLLDLPSKYIFYYLRFTELKIEALGTGTTFKSISSNTLRTLSFSLAPLPEQHRIVAEIEKQFSRLDEAVAGLKRIQANLKRYRASVLKAAVEGKLTAEWRKQHPDTEPAEQLLQRILKERREQWEQAELEKMQAAGKRPKDELWKQKYKEPVAPDVLDLSALPNGWVWCCAEQICCFITKGTTPSVSKLHDGNGDVRFLKVYNLTFSGTLNCHYKPVFVDYLVHHGELQRSKVQAGDVLINIVGPPLGQVSLIPCEIIEANINQAIARFRPLSGVINRYLMYVLMTRQVMRWAIKRAKTTVGQANLTLQLCRELPLPLAPLSEQSQIIAEVERRLSIADEVEQQINTNLKRAERLRQSILKKAFSGKLVPQDPDDEPAYMLLEKIKQAQRA